MSNDSTQNSQTAGSNLKQAAQNLAAGNFQKRQALLKVLAIVAAGLFLLLIVVSVITNISKRSGSEAIFPTPGLTISPPARAKPAHPVYATDPTILEIEEKVRAIDGDLISADLEEAKLAPPSLDLNINFKQ